jgi:SAM-dependent methyltransferase
MEVFTYWGRVLEYADFEYNTTRLNERAVEIPIVRQWLDRQGSILELGNVLAHYPEAPERAVVDRWEHSAGVWNLDVFEVTGSWDQIFSISTVEHVRWDEKPREPGGSVRAIEHLRSLLAPGGRLLVTVPTGCNPPLDEWLVSGETGTDRACTLVRDGVHWRQTSEVEIMAYGQEAGWAESVWIGEWIA